MPSRGIQPKQPSAKARRIQRAKEPKLVEDTKRALFLSGRKTSDMVTRALKDLYLLKSPDALMLTRKNDLNPFEDATSLEFLMGKNHDSSLFAFASHNKKRPNNLVLGRTFDSHMLDMIELGIEGFQSIQEVKEGTPKRVGSKPALVFLGDRWQNEEVYQKLQNLLTDFLRGDVVSSLSLSGLDHALVFALAEDRVLMRGYSVALRRATAGSGAAAAAGAAAGTPAAELTLMGPCMDWQVRRTSFAARDLWRAAAKQPKQGVKRKIKNISSSAMGDKMGRVHLGRQDLSSMKVRRVKALRGTDATGGGDGGADGGNEANGGAGGGGDDDGDAMSDDSGRD